MFETILVALMLLMIIGALVAIETSRLLYSVISLGAVGFLLSIVFLFLSAPDLAITQMAVEVITLVLLLKAASCCDREPEPERWFSFGKLAALGFVVGLAVFSVGMFQDMPEFGVPVMERFADAPSSDYLRDGMKETGAANIVTAIILDFRGYDTLGEATVLFCAVVGALTVLQIQSKQQTDEADETAAEVEP